MTPDQYQRQANRTENDHQNVRRVLANAPEGYRLLHCVIGMAGELGELATALEKWLWYGQNFDSVNFHEELGDMSWYMAEGLNATNGSFEAVLHANIEKLRKRFPEKFTVEQAAEENRDRKGEREILEALNLADNSHEVEALGTSYVTSQSIQDPRQQTGQGWAEPPVEETPEASVGAAMSHKQYADQQLLKNRMGWPECTCEVIEASFPTPVMRYSSSCQIHGARPTQRKRAERAEG